MAPQAGLVAGWCPSGSGSGSGGDVDDMAMAMKVGMGAAVWMGALPREHEGSAGD